jgi:hypothetical protein
MNLVAAAEVFFQAVSMGEELRFFGRFVPSE